MNSLTLRRTTELLGMLAVGDGLIATLAPTRHVELWRGGPGFWEATVDFFSQRPALSRAVGIAEMGVGVWMMLRSLEPGEGEARLAPRPARHPGAAASERSTLPRTPDRAGHAAAFR